MLNKETIKAMHAVDQAYNELQAKQMQAFKLLDKEPDADEILDSYGTIFKQTNLNHATFSSINIEFQQYLNELKANSKK